MPRSEQWWSLGLWIGGEFHQVKNTRSRMIRDRWMRQHDNSAHVECWSIGGRFDGEVYATGEVTR